MFLIEKIKKSIFPFYRSVKAKKIFNILNSEKRRQAMFVGGCVRKYILNEKIDDIDIATTLTPNEIIERFENSDVKVKKTGVEHGTLTLIVEDQKFEITTLRKDISTDGRHADVEFTEDWKEDSSRRDFTINAIYLDQNGKIFDPMSGVKDLKNNKIKFIGDPNIRIKEDYLRILRFLRFSIHYQSFEIDNQTQKAIKQNLDGITKLSKERVYSELEKIVKLKNFYEIFKNKFLIEIFKLIFPEFLHLDRIKKFEKLNIMNDIEINTDLIFASMLLDSSNNYKYFFHKYNVSNELKNNLNLYFKLLNEIKLNKDFFVKDLRKSIFFYGRDQIKKIFIINSIANKKKFSLQNNEILSKINNVLVPKFPVTGNDLLKKGVQSGKKVGDTLKKIEKKWIENNFQIKDEEINFLLKKNI
ncbi:MAG: poly(A) polymerase [Candidatus Marinimicrobia bacterium]|nr:poly(A) polymerase [Candidatus Neomarinimicrobiota bacterium]RPG05411.1 MAG: CCA tRNA nucleotidyltransferase [Pelagibacteraceae bacterium TMED247]|tara:strand:- start:494 stop:1738 length:1245 start_codon:yes stop_codon:yes gene_type:complete